MTKKRLSPSLVATIILAPIVGVELVLLITGVWSLSLDIVFVVILNIVFWLLNFYIWRQTGRARS